MIIVKNRELLIPENERYIGTNYDAGMENRLFRIPRYSQSGTDLSDLTFKINLIFDGDPLDRAEMAKEIDDDYIYLTWAVTAAQVAVTGTVFVCITGNDTNDTVKWSSFQAAFYTEKSMGDDIDTAYHDLVNKVAKEITDRENAVTAERTARESADAAETSAREAAVSAEATARQAADTTLQQNIDAEAAARAAGDAAANTRIDNIVAQSGDDITEIVDARTGTDSTVYASLKARLDAENSNVKSQLDATKLAMPSLDYRDTIAIQTGTDLNDLKEFGNYSIASNTVATTLLNLPEDFTNAGRLFVMRAQSTVRTIQILIDANVVPQMWMRYFNGSAWKPWQLFVSDYNNVLTLNHAKTTPITANSDVNSLTSIGNYSIASSSVATTLLNLPEDFTNAGRLFVMAAQQSNGRYLQILLDANITPQMWMRYFNGSEWKPWVRFSTKEVKISDGELINCGWVVGAIENGYMRETSHSTSNKRILSDYIFVGQNTSLTINDSNYNYTVSIYDLDKVYTGSNPTSGWATTVKTVTFDSDCFIRIMCREHTDAVLTDADIPVIVGKLKMEYYNPTVTDYRLSIEDIPSYYDEPLASAVASIRQNMDACGQNGDTFIFITDLHWDPIIKYKNRNARRSPALVKKIIEETGLKKIVFGGDYFTGNDSAEFEFEQLRSLFNAFNIKNTLTFPIIGNHDFNGYNTTTGMWDNRTAYAQIIKQCENYVQMGDDLNYYYDVSACKTRYVFLNTKDAHSRWTASDSAAWTEQMTWLNTTLNSTPNGYKIVVLMHIYYDVGGASTEYAITLSAQGQEVAAICDTFNSQNTGKVVSVIITGHAHRDYNDTTPGGIPVVMTDCDSSTQVLSGRDATWGTTGENCFDVVTLDYVNGKIYIVRIGRGGSAANRSINLYS